MYCASVRYPFQENMLFDFDNYSKNIAPRYAKLLGDNCTKYEVRKGISSPNETTPRFICIANFWITSPEEFGKSMQLQEMRMLMAEIASLTAAQPIRQI